MVSIANPKSILPASLFVKWQDLSIILSCSVNRKLLFPCTDGLREIVEDRFRVLPADASIGDTDAVLETSLAFRRDLLGAYIVGSVS